MKSEMWWSLVLAAALLLPLAGDILEQPDRLLAQHR